MKERTEGRLTLPEKVRKVEQEYIDQRRKAVKLPRKEAGQPVGLALSGGGIRSATFALGVLQKLARKNSLRLVDYMTTVSGGGYIGSCLSSLMSFPEPDIPPADDNVSIDQKAFTNFNLSDNFPLSRADQMHHLRKHGSFLVLREGLFRKDVLRAIGLFLVGIFSTFFLLTLPLLIVVGLSIAYIALVGIPDLSADCLIKIDWDPEKLFLPASPYALVTGIGFLIGIALSFCIPLLHSIWKKTGGNLGETEEDYMERTCLTTVFTVFYLVAVGIFIGYMIKNHTPTNPKFFTFSSFLIPVLFCLGNFAGAAFFYTFIVAKRSSMWTLKSRSLLGASIAVMFNSIIVFLFLAIVAFCIWAVLGEHLGELAQCPPKDLNQDCDTPPGMFFLIVSGISFILTRMFALKGNAPKSDSGLIGKLTAKIPLLILQISVPLFMFSAYMLCMEWSIKLGGIDSWQNGLLLAAGSLITLVVGGYLIDVNRLSIHYFYRDRLAETYLQTERHEAGELKLIRNDSSMRIADLNCQGNHINNPFPYHIILCSLNLAGSRDLARRTRKSDHFIFSREYCGSGSTGYVPTEKYRNGNTKLSTAMTISGAAVGSNMGFQTSFARAFAMTLFNVRLGYWIVNPRVYDQEQAARQEIIQFPTEKQPRAKWLEENWKHKLFPFSPYLLEKNIWWPWFLRAELMGDTNSQGRLVNLSDGGHTGDNIGLYPLFQRRCRLIFASDAECDPGYSFGSLINAINQIFIDENVVVEIDVTQLRPDEEGGPGKAHYLIGKINYPADPDRKGQDAEESTGWLIYLKSSLIHNYYKGTRNEAHHQRQDLKHEPPAVQSFAIHSKDFPHETTADQFYDDDQFEAYRALGYHVASSMFDAFDTWYKHQPTDNEKKPKKPGDPTVEDLMAWCKSVFEKTEEEKEETE
ncbi:patatin-like phospholipase family protein [Gimesia sp.]|uniref:patatin-like phospholipase family protein n=1 Tax=Gimesia sp. TaxID=2024833 RepID=UPI003A928214